MSTRDLQGALSAPFPRKDVEFRIGRISPKNRKASVLAYITARAIMERLDAVFGIDGWKDEYEVLASGVKCRLSVKAGNEWVTKEDVAPFTNIEALKGAFSDSLKRAGVKFGIGRYLYDLPEYWVQITEERPRDCQLPVHYHGSDGLSGYWEEPQLPDWALPEQKDLIPSEYLTRLDDLFQRQLLTSARYEQYKQALAHPQTGAAQRSLIWEQLGLITLWGDSIPANPNIKQDAKRELYRRILNSTSNTIDGLKSEILALAQGGEAA